MKFTKYFILLIKFLPRIFTSVNISVILVIFIVGFFTRFFVNCFFSTNVFVEYLTPISIIYYSIFSCFIVFIRNFFNFFSISIIPNSFVMFFSDIFKMLKLILSFLSKFKFEYLKLSFLRSIFRDVFSSSKEKISMYVEQEHFDVSHPQKDITKDTLVLNQDNINDSSSSKDKGKGKGKANYTKYNDESNLKDKDKDKANTSYYDQSSSETKKKRGFLSFLNPFESKHYNSSSNEDNTKMSVRKWFSSQYKESSCTNTKDITYIKATASTPGLNLIQQVNSKPFIVDPITGKRTYVFINKTDSSLFVLDPITKLPDPIFIDEVDSRPFIKYRNQRYYLFANKAEFKGCYIDPLTPERINRVYGPSTSPSSRSDL